MRASMPTEMLRYLYRLGMHHWLDGMEIMARLGSYEAIVRRGCRGRHARVQGPRTPSGSVQSLQALLQVHAPLWFCAG